MKYIYQTLILCLFGIRVWAVTPEYYSDLEGKQNVALITAIGNVAAKGYVGTLTYDGLWNAYKTTDLYPSDSIGRAGMIWDIYSHCLFIPGENQDKGSHPNECYSYNREHTLPKSWFGGETETGTAGTDIFHIYPTDSWTNSVRSNYPYGECTNGQQYGIGKFGKSTFNGYSGNVFEPNDEFKGDLARTYFYMVAFWGKEKQVQFQSLGLIHFNNDYSLKGNFGLTDYSIDLLMKWHRQDPVSQKEINRNNACQNIAGQGNRNPFIDYPYLAEYLWGTKKGTPVRMENLMGSFDKDFVPNKSDGHRETSFYSVTLMRNGVAQNITNLTGTYILPATEPDICNGYHFVGWSSSPINDSSDYPSLVTEVSDNAILYAIYETGSPLLNNDTVVIYFPAKSKILTMESSTSGLKSEDATLRDDTLHISNHTAEMILEQENGYYLLRLGTTYLTCPATGNGLSFTDKNDYAYWNIDAGSPWYISSAFAKYGENVQYLELYNDIFKTYSYNATKAEPYALQVLHKRNGYYVPISSIVYTSAVQCSQKYNIILSRCGTNSMIPNLSLTYTLPTINEEQSACDKWDFVGWTLQDIISQSGIRPDMKESITPKEANGKTITFYAVYRFKGETPTNGSKVVIYHPKSQTVISTSQINNKLVGIEAEQEGDILNINDGTAEMTWTNHNDAFSLSIDDKYLSGYGGNVGLTFTSMGDSSLWIFEEKNYRTIIKNTTITYDSRPQYLEYYNGFTIYGFQESSADAYFFDIYKKIGNTYHIIGNIYSTMPNCLETTLMDSSWIDSNTSPVRKRIENGHFVIIRGNQKYSLTGNIIH